MMTEQHKLFRTLAFSPLKHLASKLKAEEADSLDNVSDEHAKLIAADVLQWAKQNGVTHYTFWIQPQTQEMIEKHDAFFELEYTFDRIGSAKQVHKFNGTVLQRGEGDGSSFPNGGLRGTEKARAYIAWDSKADLFIRDGINKTLYIPAMLITHNGEALDEKSYLRRAEANLKASVLKLLSVLGETEAKSVMYNLGIEQEFFVVKKDAFEKRLDLQQTGRTLYGALPPKNQQFSDHYYSRIDDRIFEILNEVENELLKMGVPVKTKHREVAINQYEMSNYYEDGVLAVDHNMLCMDILKATFDKHGYKVLFQEKPFKGANGSGKHCNWSLAYSKNGKFINLFEPGENANKNIRFILFVLMTLKTVQDNAGLLKASVTSPSNQYRMGGHEAPPCIISVFLGSFVDRLLNSIENGQDFLPRNMQFQNLIPGLMTFEQDNTDRNRTSPFAFTGNKFEFRAVGSKQNVSFPMTVLAAGLSKIIKEVTAEIERGVDPWEIAKKMIAETKRIRFQGDGYSKAWEEEAAKRGLPNLRNALDSFSQIRDCEMLVETGVFNKNELAAKYNILMKNYEITRVAEADTQRVLINQMFANRAVEYLEKLSCLNKNIPTFNKKIQNVESKLEDLLLLDEKLKLMVDEVNNAVSLEDKVRRASDLKIIIDQTSRAMTDLEQILPCCSEQYPQLYDILNRY